MRYLTQEYWNKFIKIVNWKDKEKTVRDGIEFEKLVKYLLLLKFQGNWTDTKASHDNNRDFYLYSERDRIWAECKNYQDSIAMSTLAPTLVMAQIFNVDQIIFFSYSPVNDNAKRKIFAFGRKVRKKIRIYDDYKLEELIIEAGNGLPEKFRPIFRPEFGEIVSDNVDIQMFARLEPSLATDDEMTDFIPYKKIPKIFYNKSFALYMFFFNLSALHSYHLKIRIIPEKSPDLLFFECLDDELLALENHIGEISVDCAEGTVIQRLLKPIIYKKQLVLPVFEVEVWENDTLQYRWQNEQITLDCAWIGQTKLIGSHYQTILREVEDKVLSRQKVGVAAIYGESGTGKTRLLTELMDKLLNNRYRILNFIGAENNNDYNILKEIIYFLYEIPRSMITENLESYLFPITGRVENGSAEKGIQLLNKIFNAQDAAALETYYDIIFDKISSLHLAILFDNIQYYNEILTDFITKYIKYAQNQCHENHSVLLCAFNIDFITKNSLELLNSIRILEHTSDSVYTAHLSGFKDENQGILFLRELIHADTEANDLLFSRIIKKVTAKPYYLYQAIKYLEEENSIYYASGHQGFLIDNEAFYTAVMKMPENINFLLRSRYEKLIQNSNESQVLLIFSTIFLFGMANEFLSEKMNLDRKLLDELLFKRFLERNNDNSLVFEHDIIRTFLSHEIPRLEKYAICYIIDHDLSADFAVYPFAYSFILLSKKKLGKQQFSTVASISKKVDIHLYLCDNFYNLMFTKALNKKNFFKDFGTWFSFLYNVCKIIRDRLGSLKALEYYKLLYQTVLLNKDECYNEIRLFQAFIMSYTDLLSHLKKNEEAIHILKRELNLAVKYHDKLKDNHIFAFEAVICNRLHVNYKDYSDAENQAYQQYYLEQAEKKTKYIESDSERRLLEYLNLSDKGYCYYCMQDEKDKLLEIWNQCLQYTPQILPEKTMNYYRKCVQLDLIIQDITSIFVHNKKAMEYLETGEFAHEHLIFKHFFQVSKCIAYLMYYSCDNDSLIERSIHLASELQKILNNGKMKDIFILRGIHNFYQNKPNETFFNFREAYYQFEKNALMTNYERKWNLLIDNILYAFNHMHIWENGLYQCDFILGNARVKEFLSFDSNKKADYMFRYEAKGIIRTKDLLFNLPMI